MIQITDPDLSELALGGANLYLLEALGFSSDGKGLLVRATFTDDADPGQLHYAVWVYDLTLNAYVRCLNVDLAPDGVNANEIDVLSASFVGSGADIQVVAQTQVRGGDALLVALQSGVLDANLLATLLGQDLAAGIRVESYSLSQDGRFLAVQTDSVFLSTQDTNGYSDIYLMDLQANQVERVSFLAGAEVMAPALLGSVRAANSVVQVAFSSPGVFSTSDKNTESASPMDAYLWAHSFDDSGLTGAATISLVSSTQSGLAGGGVDAEQALIVTAGGVFFNSSSGELVAVDTNTEVDAFLKSAGATTTRIDLSTLGELAGGMTFLSASQGGRVIALASSSDEISLATQAQQIVVLDLQTGDWHVASSNGLTLANDWSQLAVLSSRGDQLAFTSSATNLGGSASEASAGTLYVVSTGLIDAAAPAITSGATATVAENTTASTVIYTATATDVDANDTKTYSLAGTDASLLAIDSSTGAVTLNASANYEAKSSYSFDVVVTDSGGLTGTQAVTLSVTNVNEAPTGTVSISGTATQDEVLTAVSTLADEDGLGEISYQWRADGVDINGATGATYTLTQAEVGRLITVVASYTDGGGASESVTSAATAAVEPSGIDINIQAHAWNTPTAPLVGVSIVATGATLSETLSTDATGKASLSGVGDQSLSLTASLSASSAVSQSVNLTDAIAILKLIVGLPVNAGGAALSPYQALAADFDGNGSVQLTDAIGVLKHVVGLQAPKPEWRFVDEANADIAAIANHPLSPGQVPALDLDLSQAQAEPQLTLVGLIAGDVNGSYAG